MGPLSFEHSARLFQGRVRNLVGILDQLQERAPEGIHGHPLEGVRASILPIRHTVAVGVRRRG